MTTRIQRLLIAGTVGLLSLTACAPMQTYDRDRYSHDDEYPRDDGRDYPYDQGYDVGRTALPVDAYQDERNYRAEGRFEQACDNCGFVRRITQIGGDRRDNTGAIIVGAVVGGALGNTVGRGDGRRAATVVGAVAGGAVANNMTRDHARYDVYRIEVQMSNGDMYSFEQNNIDGLEEGSPVDVIDGRVYPAR